MKKQLLIIGLATLVGITYAQVGTTIVEQTVKVRAVIPPQVNSALMSEARIPSGNIIAQGNNVVISGMATITIPKSAIGQLVELNQGGTNTLNPNNFVRGTFTLGTNGTTVIAEFRK